MLLFKKKIPGNKLLLLSFQFNVSTSPKKVTLNSLRRNIKFNVFFPAKSSFFLKKQLH